nr:D-alanyl-D-alanine carboxypeptidase family protein [Chthonobacter albigriseus]
MAGTLAIAAALPAAAGPYLVFDARTGEVLAESQAFDPWYPASLTKMMTAYVTFRAIEQGRLRPDSLVVMTANASKEPPSKMGFKPGTALSVDTALKMLIVKSANDIAVALAETVGGGEAEFVALMNAEARRLGMDGTRFVNPNGLPDPRQWSTARDFAVLSRAIIAEYPQYSELFRITALSLGAKVIKSHNHLLERYPGTDGMKTGFICASGYNVVASATRGGRRLVAVVLGERNARVRAEKAAQLLEAGFRATGGFFSRKVKLDTLRPDVAPPSLPTDMRDFVCGKNRNAGEDADDQSVATAGVGKGEARSYLVPPFKLMDPVPVALGGTVDLVPSPAGSGVPLDADLPPLPLPNPARRSQLAPTAAPAPTTVAPSGATVGVLPPAPPPIEILGLRGNSG